MRRVRLGRRVAGRSVIAAAVGGALIAGMAVAASATTGGPARAAPSPAAGMAGMGRHVGFVAKPHAVRLPAGERTCARPSRPGVAQCQLIIETSPGAIPALAGVPAIGYGPSDLRSAYGLTRAALRAGGGKTVAIVDAFNNPELAKNLATYRRHFRLPACSLSTHCLRIVNQAGGRRLPSIPRPSNPNFTWTEEESLDLDMVSAICPRCHILLVEATNSADINLGIAENTAIRMGARFVSNSWSGGEFVGQDTMNHFFNHPGTALVFASGDFGYGPAYPTDLQYVTAVGGTKLVHSRTARGWSESVWGGTGSGCSTLEAKPSWQTADNVAPNGCLNRTENDVAAVADPNTGVDVVDTYATGGTFFMAGGTSAATPIITATYALAGNPAKGTYPAAYPYRHATSFNKVTAGSNGACESFRRYLCHGQRGYNGPTGLGTPKGTGGFSAAGLDPVTVIDPGTQDVLSGSTFTLTVRALDSDLRATSLSYGGTTGLPPGLHIASARRSLNGVITGTLPTVTTATGYKVTVTARDGRVRRSNSTHFEIYVLPSVANTTNAPAAGHVTQAFSAGNCLSASAATPGAVVSTQPCGGANQDWQFVSGAAPGSTNTLELGTTGNCLGLTPGGLAVLDACGSARNEQWQNLPSQLQNLSVEAVLYNPASGLCLTASGTQDKATGCVVTASQGWALSATSVVSGINGQCLSLSGTTLSLATCSSSDATQAWLPGTGNLQAQVPGTCLAINSAFDRALPVMEDCGTADGFGGPQPPFAGIWQPGPGGQLINAFSGRCLDDVGGTLQLNDCYGQPGEVWALN